MIINTFASIIHTARKSIYLNSWWRNILKCLLLLLKLQIYPGFNKALLDLLLKLCNAVFDELPRKENVLYNPEHDEVEDFEDVGIFKYFASHCVFVERFSLYMEATNWPFSSQQYCKCWFAETSSVLIVKGIMCDQVSTNQSKVTKLGTSVSKSYFIHNNNHVIIFYDPPHLL